MERSRLPGRVKIVSVTVPLKAVSTAPRYVSTVTVSGKPTPAVAVIGGPVVRTSVGGTTSIAVEVADEAACRWWR